jgi:hypothetical protein
MPASSFPGNPLYCVLNTGPINLRVRDADFAGCPYHKYSAERDSTA